MKTTKQLLIDARALIAEKGWTREAYARKKDGSSIFAEDSRAVCYCAIGALRKACDGKYPLKVSAQTVLAQAIRPDLGGQDSDDTFNIVTNFNDSQTSKEPVLDAFDRAIASLDE